MTEQTFWKPEPKEPWKDWRTYSMLIPILSSALGGCLFMALGFSFTEMGSILQSVRTGLVIVASFTVAFGSSFGSVGSGIEVFRKRYTGDAQGWDWISLGVSTLTTVAGFAMGFAALLGATTTWSEIAVIYGSIVVGTLAALDSTGDMIELGGLFGSYEARVERWRVEREQWRVQTGQNLVQVGDDLTQKLDDLTQGILHLTQRDGELDREFAYLNESMGQLVDRWSWPTATRADVERVTDHLDGDRANLTRQEVGLLLAKHKLNLPSQSTVKRGLQGG